MNTSTFKLTTISEKAQIKKFGKVIIAGDTEFELVYVRSAYAPIINVEFCSNEVTSWVHVEQRHELSPELFVHPFANYHGYSDVTPYEVVKYNSALKMTVREMEAELDPNFKMDVSIGGFVGHVNNQHEQSYAYTSNTENREIEIRYSKRKKQWQDKHGRRFIAARSPFKFYDYNF